MRWILGFALLLLSAGLGAEAGPLSFGLDLAVPPVVADSQAPTTCTVTYMVADIADNDLYAVRMRIDPGESDTPVNNRLPCPASMPPRVGLRALDVCTARTGEVKYCVFADMGRGFERRADIYNTAENTARCSSDRASDIGVACLKFGKLSVCDVACGNSPTEAVVKARARCEDKQQQSCPITASVPVLGP